MLIRKDVAGPICNRYRLEVVTLVIGMLITMSIQASEYPDQWPVLKKTPTGKCASLTGVYEYYGEWSDPKLNKEYGPPMIDGSVFHRPPARGRVVYINHNKKEATVSFKVEGGDPSRGVWSYQMSCVDGWILQTVNRSGYGDGTQVDTGGKVRLTRAKDGSLVVHAQEITEFRYFFIFTSNRRYEAWYRFRPVDRLLKQ
jgi:hypothetical protein